MCACIVDSRQQRLQPSLHSVNWDVFIVDHMGNEEVHVSKPTMRFKSPWQAEQTSQCLQQSSVREALTLPSAACMFNIGLHDATCGVATVAEASCSMSLCRLPAKLTG